MGFALLISKGCLFAATEKTTAMLYLTRVEATLKRLAVVVCSEEKKPENSSGWSGLALLFLFLGGGFCQFSGGAVPLVSGGKCLQQNGSKFWPFEVKGLSKFSCCFP